MGTGVVPGGGKEYPIHPNKSDKWFEVILWNNIKSAIYREGISFKQCHIYQGLDCLECN